MKIIEEPLPGVLLIEPKVFGDGRGYFLETYNEKTMAEIGIREHFVQDNHSLSNAGVVRGLHFQWDPPMSKLMRVTLGRAFVVAVDIRKGSPTLGQWFGLELSAENRRLVWAPPGFARGFCALSEVAELQYKCTALHNVNGESSISPFDPDIGIQWPITTKALLSPKDRDAQTLAHWLNTPKSDLLRF